MVTPQSQAYTSNCKENLQPSLQTKNTAGTDKNHCYRRSNQCRINNSSKLLRASWFFVWNLFFIICKGGRWYTLKKGTLYCTMLYRNFMR